MKNKSEKIYHFLSFACMVALAAYIILFLHHLLTESASYMSGATYKFLVGAELVLLIIGIFTPYYGVGIRCMA